MGFPLIGFKCRFKNLKPCFLQFVCAQSSIMKYPCWKTGWAAQTGRPSLTAGACWKKLNNFGNTAILCTQVKGFFFFFLKEYNTIVKQSENLQRLLLNFVKGYNSSLLEHGISDHLVSFFQGCHHALTLFTRLKCVALHCTSPPSSSCTSQCQGVTVYHT